MRPALGASVVLVGVVLAAVSGRAHAAGPSAPALGPSVVGWWSAANRDAPTSQVPSPPDVVPPDVGPQDLYVAGTQDVALPADPPVALGPVGPAAIAGLLFELPVGATARTLTLQLTGVAPPAVSLTACRALEEFLPTYDGRWEGAPAYDCTDAGTARLGSNGLVVIDGVDRLQRGQSLAVVLVPGPLDRVVIAPPASTALAYQPGTALAGDQSPPLPGVAPAPTVAPYARVPLSTGLSPTPASAVPVAPPPVVRPGAAALPSRAAAAALPARPRGVLLAALLLAMLAFAAMVLPRRHLHPERARGVGRFRSERSGHAPDLT